MDFFMQHKPCTAKPRKVKAVNCCLPLNTLLFFPHTIYIIDIVDNGK